VVEKPANARISARITGRVQDVNVRASAAREARHLGLTGWVCNEPDGSVRIDVEGDSEKLDELLDWCAEGPSAARVDAVESTSAAPVGYEEFRILRPAWC
jgi:acylphosphatase